MPSARPAFAVFALCACLCLSSCQSTGLGGSGFGGSNRLAAQTSDYERTIAEGVSAGAVIGGFGAGIVTAATGGSSRDVARNAAIGTLIGAVVGGAGGYGVAESKRSYVRTEDRLQAVIRRARTSNAKLKQLVATADDLVRKRRAEAAALGKASRERRQALRSAITEDQGNLTDAIGAARKDIAQLRSLKGRYGGSKALDAEIGAAEARRSQLTRSQATLTGIKEKL